MYTAGELRAARQDDPDTWQRGAPPRDPRHLQTRARHAHIRAQVRPRVTCHDIVTCHMSRYCHNIVTCHVSRVTCCSPANAFQPPLTILSSMTRVDWATGVAPYEFYREKAWQVSPRVSIYHATCLLYHVSDQPRPRPSRRGDPLHQERGGVGQEAQVR